MSSTPTDRSNRTYFGVQALRAVAALLVVVHHSLAAWQDRIAHPPVASLWSNGAAGVDIFFVISGFVMAVSAPGLAGRDHAGWVFLRRRFVRLVPLYWIITTVRLVRLHVGPQMPGQTAGSLWHIVASYLFVPAFDDSGTITPLLAVGWTLNFEMAFYLLFALALAWNFRPLLFLGPALMAVAAAGCLDHASWPAFTTLLSPLVLEFLFGIVLANFALSNRLPGKAAGALLLAGGFIAICMVPDEGAACLRLLAWGLPAAAIVTGTVALEEPFRRGLPRWLLEVGNASYAIYLVHLFVVGVVWVVVRRAGITGYPAMAAILAAALPACVVAGEIVHRLVELPLMRLFRGRNVPGVSALPA